MGQTDLEYQEIPASADTNSGCIPAPDSNGDIRLIWKLKGTGKKARRDVISECTKGQPVFIICDSNGDNCTVITEEGEEIGRLSDKNSKTYHEFVEKHPYNLYIKRIRFDPDKPRVKILLIVHEKPLYPLDELYKTN